MRVTAFSDGAHRPSTGYSSYGFVIYDDENVILTSGGKCIGRHTNNIAEYRGAIAAVDAAINLGATHIILKTDSMLVVNQFTGDWRVKKEHLRPLLKSLKSVTRKANDFTIEWIPREQNEEADRMADNYMCRN